MQLTITEKKESPLLSRIEIKGTLSFDQATPSNEELKKNLADNQKTKPELVVIKHIYTEYGKPQAEVIAYIYESKEALEKTEPKPKKKEAKPGEKPAEAPAEKPAKEAPKAEKPAEKKE